jgi:hypothetical protein
MEMNSLKSKDMESDPMMNHHDHHDPWRQRLQPDHGQDLVGCLASWAL